MVGFGATSTLTIVLVTFHVKFFEFHIRTYDLRVTAFTVDANITHMQLFYTRVESNFAIR